MAADIIGTGGRTRVDGATIRARLGLYDTWAYFTSIKTGTAPPPEEPAGPPTPSRGTRDGRVAAGPSRPASARAGCAARSCRRRAGARITVQRRDGGRWATIGTVRAGAGGRYEAAVSAAGTYRVRYRGDAGPAVRIG